MSHSQDKLIEKKLKYLISTEKNSLYLYFNVEGGRWEDIYICTVIYYWNISCRCACAVGMILKVLISFFGTCHFSYCAYVDFKWGPIKRLADVFCELSLSNFCSVVGCIMGWGAAWSTAIIRLVVFVKAASTWIPRPKACQQSIALQQHDQCYKLLPVNDFNLAADWSNPAHTHEHTQRRWKYLATDKLLTHLSVCQCLESNYLTLFTQGALTQLSPRRGYIEGVLLLTTLSWTDSYKHTFPNTHTCSHADMQLCAHRWSNYRHFNHWTLLLWGTADIAGSGQK